MVNITYYDASASVLPGQSVNVQSNILVHGLENTIGYNDCENLELWGC